jgi:hypothetical protein
MQPAKPWCHFRALTIFEFGLISDPMKIFVASVVVIERMGRMV